MFLFLFFEKVLLIFCNIIVCFSLTRAYGRLNALLYVRIDRHIMEYGLFQSEVIKMFFSRSTETQGFQHDLIWDSEVPVHLATRGRWIPDPGKKVLGFVEKVLLVRYRPDNFFLSLSTHTIAWEKTRGRSYHSEKSVMLRKSSKADFSSAKQNHCYKISIFPQNGKFHFVGRSRFYNSEIEIGSGFCPHERHTKIKFVILESNK